MGVTRADTESRPNAVVVGMRRARGWSQARLAREFQVIGQRLGLPVPDSRETIVKQISRVESGETQVPGEMYLRLWCEALQADAAELFGQLDASVLGEDGRALFAVTSHQFIPTYLGAGAALRVGLASAPDQWMNCLSGPLAHPSGVAELYVWPFGVAVVHVREDLEFASMAQLAVWRRAAYPVARSWVDEQLQEMTGDASAASRYVLSAYWLSRPKWTGEALDTAMRLLAMPSVLLDREDETVDDVTLLSGAELVERALLRDANVERADLVSFGARGVSIGYASWSGVAYHPVAARRALAVAELVACELTVQAIWCYTSEILRQIEAGTDPVLPDEYGWRFLRGVRSRLTAPRALETGQHNSMRDAVLLTSGLGRLLDAVIDALR